MPTKEVYLKKTMKDELGDRMKSYYENRSKTLDVHQLL